MYLLGKCLNRGTGESERYKDCEPTEQIDGNCMESTIQREQRYTELHSSIQTCGM